MKKSLVFGLFVGISLLTFSVGNYTASADENVQVDNVSDDLFTKDLDAPTNGYQGLVILGSTANSYTTTTPEGRITVHDIIMYATGKELTTFPGSLNTVYSSARSVIKSKYGSISNSQKYKITYDTYSYPTNLWSRKGGISNVRVVKV